MALIYDEIGYWSEIKLEIIEKYAKAYSQILTNQSWAHHIYVDAFAGAGSHISKTTKSLVRGSPQIALDIEPSFKEYYFIDIKKEKVSELKKISEQSPKSQKIHVLEGDCNKALLQHVYPHINKPNMRTLCLLDPYGLTLDWQIIEAAGKMCSVEIFLNFPVMDMNRNALLINPQKISEDNAKRMDLFWGDHTWNDIAYSQTTDMFEDIHETKQKDISKITFAFQQRLIDIAKFQYVPKPIPMRNGRRGLLYYLFFASNNKTGARILSEIFSKYRERGMK